MGFFHHQEQLLQSKLLMLKCLGATELGRGDVLLLLGFLSGPTKKLIGHDLMHFFMIVK